MRAKARRCPPGSTMEMHCGTPISFAFAIAACRSFIAPSDVSFSDATVSAMVTSVREHFPEKWIPVFRRKCDQLKSLADLLNVIAGDFLIALEDRPQLDLADDILEPVEA